VSLKGRIGVLSSEREHIRDEKECFANKVISLQAGLDQVEEFQDTVNQILEDIYYHVWENGSFDWMNDYPQVMVGIHTWLLEELRAVGRLSGEPFSDMGLVDAHFSLEEREAIRKGYELLATEAAEGEEEGEGLAGLGEKLTVGL